MKTARIKITLGEPPEDYVSIPFFFGDDMDAKFAAHIVAQKNKDRMDRAKDVTPKREGEK